MFFGLKNIKTNILAETKDADSDVFFQSKPDGRISKPSPSHGGCNSPCDSKTATELSERNVGPHFASCTGMSHRNGPLLYSSKWAEFRQHAFHLPAAHLLWMDVPAKWPIFLTWPVIKDCNKIVMLAGVKPTLVHFCCRQPSSNALRRFHSRLLSFCRYSKKKPERKN